MKGFATNQWPWSSEANRPDHEKTLETFLTEAADAGYDAVECLADGLAEAAKGQGIRVCGAYVGGPLHKRWWTLKAKKAFLTPARQIAELGGDYLVVNSDPKGAWNERQRKTEDELKRQGENMSRLARELEPLGLRLLLHNHANTSDLHLDDLKSVTDYAAPEVGVCLDTGWALTSADDPVERARALGRRLAGTHLRNQRGEVPVEWLGEGDMDIAAFVQVLKDIDYSGWITTELWHRQDVDVTRSLVDDQRRTVELLRQLWSA